MTTLQDRLRDWFETVRQYETTVIRVVVILLAWLVLRQVFLYLLSLYVRRRKPVKKQRSAGVRSSRQQPARKPAGAPAKPPAETTPPPLEIKVPPVAPREPDKPVTDDDSGADEYVWR